MSNTADVVNESKDAVSTYDARAQEIENRLKNCEEDESGKKRYPYPWHVAFILGNEVCERYSFYGMKTILAIYLKNKLLYSEKDSKLIYHIFNSLCYFTPLLGACLADQFLGKFKTILYLSCVYVAGHIIKTVGSMTSFDSIPHTELSLLGLVVIAFGTGGIKPCVSALAGDQFKLPEQERHLQRFFAIFYMSINMGSLISTLVGPELRTISCLGEEDCYPLAFGVPALLMFIATVIIIIGKPFYTIKPSDGIVSKSLGILWKGLTNCCGKKGKSHQHCLDAAKESYEEEVVDEIKFLTSAKGILVLFTPLIMFWCLFDQTSTTWVFQAEHMYGLKADQVQFINPALIIILIPVFELIIYPLLAKRNLLVKPLQRMSVGMFLAALSFLIAGILELVIRNNPDKSLHVMWQLPQYLVMTVAEVMVSVTGLAFAYTQAAPSMKSILQACWLLTIGFGNTLTVIITAIAGTFENRAHGIFLYTGLMLLCSFIFSYLAWRYVPRENIGEGKDENKESDYSEDI